jgi:hypothetical protein
MPGPSNTRPALPRIWSSSRAVNATPRASYTSAIHSIGKPSGLRTPRSSSHISAWQNGVSATMLVPNDQRPTDR